ncbi:MAG: hypothetical protein V2A73_03800 [Pseudomonadota bacterium]
MKKLLVIVGLLLGSLSASAQSSDFDKKCSEKGGKYTGTACQCPDGSYINPYVAVCKKSDKPAEPKK